MGATPRYTCVPGLARTPEGRLRLTLLVCAAIWGGSANFNSFPAVHAQQAAELYNKAMGAFAAGDFATALGGLREMLTLGADGPGMESVHFSIAATHFNLQDAASAKAAFANYLKLYPSGTRAAEAQMAIAQCQVLLGDKAGAATTFAEVAQRGGANREQALLAQATLLRETGRVEDAANLLQSLVAPGLKSSEGVQAALLLGSVEASRGERAKALTILEALQGRLLWLVDNPLQLNALAFEVGDAFLKAGEFRQALKTYAMVRRKEETVQLQQSRIQGLARQYEANIGVAKADSSRAIELASANQRIKAQVETLKQTLEQAVKTPDNTAALRARQAAAYQGIGRLEEAAILFESIANGKDAGREDALYSLGSLYAQLGETADCVRALQEYLKSFPAGQHADTVQLLLANQFLQLEQLEEAVPLLEAILKRKPESAHAGAAQFLLANTRFSQARYGDAQAAYQTYLKRFAKGEYIEEARYRIGLAQFFAGKYGAALEAFQEYKSKHPEGLFGPDSDYRIAACYSAASRPADVVRLCQEWEKRFGDHPVAGDVYALHADALTALDRRQEAVDYYRKSVANAMSEEVVHYSLFAANKELQKLGQWAAITAMFREFLSAKPDHPSQVLAMYWVARAMAKEGKSEEAKTFLSEKISEFIGDRSKDAVEQLLGQLAQLCSKPPRPEPVQPAADGRSAETFPKTGAAPPPYDPLKNLEQHLARESFPKSPLVEARVLFAKAELARLTRKPAEAAAALDAICDKLPADALGASLLAQCGDRLWERSEKERAAKFYKELQRAFPKSDVLEYAYNGLGQIALAEGKAEAALKLFEEAVDKAGASAKLRDVTLGRGKALRLLGRDEEAKAILEQVASTREWRGECTAEAVFLLGEIMAKKGDLPGAIQYFQRVFVAYQRYERPVARAYLRAAECFETLGEPEKAATHYREMLSKPRLAGLPETATARKRLKTETAQ